MSETKKVDPAIADRVTPELAAAVMGAASDGKITCAVLRKLAEDMNVSYKVAGAAADLNEIRVHDCGLGCF
ncbi:MAG: hypothetical protein PF636_01830 [Actinomycetota bacterium]|jgi:hypothetical protein|nr:hypothetical protein [Actinomycetota bacterium]